MGEVYKAHDPRLNRTVAIKVLATGVASPERVQQLEQEARAASALNHPNILTIYDVGPQWIAMEWIDGGSLRDLMNAGRLPLRRVIQIAQQIAEGLAKAHAAGIVHRDLKPENVMITRDGLVKIVDFGIAKLSDAGGTADGATRTMTMAGLVVGTVGYMSPEQAAGRAVDYRSDQFSLGLLVYEMVTGVKPFERATTAQSLAATIESEPAPIETLNPSVQPHLAAIVARCLEKDPADRYESTRDLAKDLKSASAGHAAPEGAAYRDAAPEDTAYKTSYAARLGTMRTYAVTIVLLAFAVLAGFNWLTHRKAQPAATSTAPLLAVRPFRSLSPDPAQGYFAAGMTEEIRGQLSQVASLRILARNAVEGSDADAATKMRTLGVTQVVDGTVRVEGKRVRVTAELVDALTQQTLWSDQYDRELADVLAVQSDVAVQIARALRARVSPDEQKRLDKRPTANAEAYALYLQAAPTGFDRAQDQAAIGMLRRALALDPNFAAAQARLSFVHVTMGYYDSVSYVDQGIAEAEEALRMDPSLPLPHFVIGTGYLIKGMDQQARASFQRALELDPNNADAMANLSILDTNSGRLEDAALWSRRMFALSGQRGNDFYHACAPLLLLRAEPELRQLLTEGERRFPAFQRIQYCWSVLELYDGKLAESYARISRTLQRLPNDEEMKFTRADIAFLAGAADAEAALATIAAPDVTPPLAAESVRLRRGYFHVQRGDREGGRALVEEAERVARGRIDGGDDTPSLRVEMAAAAVLRGDHASAAQWLDRAYDAGYRDYGVLERDPILAKLQPAAALRGVLDRMKRDVDAQRAGARAKGLLDIDALLAPAKAR